MKLNSLRIAILGSVAAIGLVACGGSDQGTGPSNSATIAASPGSSSPLDQPFKLTGAAATDVDALLGTLNMTDKLTYGDAAFDDAIGATVLTDVTISEGAQTTIGRVEIYGFNEAGVNALKAGDATKGPQEIFRKLRFFDIASTFAVPGNVAIDYDTNHFAATEGAAPAQGTVTIAAMEFDTLNLAALTPTEGEETPEGAGIAAAAQAVSFGGMALKGFAYSLPDPDSKDTSITVNAEAVQTGSYKAGTFGGMTMTGLDYVLQRSDEALAAQAAALGPQAGMILNTPLRNMVMPASQAGKIGQFTWDGFSFAGLLPYMESGETPPTDAKNLLSFGKMEFLDQSVMVNGKTASTIERTLISPIQFAHLMPKQVKVASQGVTTDITAYVGDENEEVRDILVKNGLDNISSKSDFEYNFDPKSGDISMTSNGVADGVYAMDFALDLGGFDYDALMASIEAEEEDPTAILNMRMDGMTFRMDDDKMLDTLFAVLGASNGEDPAKLRQQAIGLLTLGALQGAQFSPRITNYASALSSFIGEGGTLEIKVDPENPVTFGALAASAQTNPASVLEALNLTVERSD